MKRVNTLSWEEYFMGIAHLSALRSKDPATQVGACIVDQNNKIVGIGYNGLPYGCSDDEFPWSKVGETLDTKYPYVVHAELNAILNSNKDITGCTLYVSLFPCNECAKAIIQSHIGEIIFEDDKNFDSDQVRASRKMLDAAGIGYRQLKDFKKISIQDSNE